MTELDSETIKDKNYVEYRQYITITKTKEGIMNASDMSQREFISKMADDTLFYIDEKTPYEMIINLIKSEEKWDWKLGGGNSGSVTQSIINGNPVTIKKFKNKFEGIYISANYLTLAKKLGIRVMKMDDPFVSMSKASFEESVHNTREHGSKDHIFNEEDGYRLELELWQHAVVKLNSNDGIYCKSRSGDIIRTLGLYRDIASIYLNNKRRQEVKAKVYILLFELYREQPTSNHILFKNIPKFIYTTKEFVYHINYIIAGRKMVDSDKIDLTGVMSTVKLLHEAGFCHLDISMRNIIVNKARGELIDFDLMTPIGQASVLPLPLDVSSENAMSRFQIELSDDDIGLEKIKAYEIEKVDKIEQGESCCTTF